MRFHFDFLLKAFLRKEWQKKRDIKSHHKEIKSDQENTQNLLLLHTNLKNFKQDENGKKTMA